MGCEIVFKNSDKLEIARIKTDLNYEQSSLNNIVNEYLLNNISIRELLLTELLGKTKTVEITKNDIIKNGVVPNTTLGNISYIHSGFRLLLDNYSSIKILDVSKFELFGKDFSLCIINSEKGPVYIINSHNRGHIQLLYEHLSIKNAIEHNLDNYKLAIENSEISLIAKLLKTKPDKLLLNYITNNLKERFLYYKSKNGEEKLIDSELDYICKLILGKDIRILKYSDPFALHIDRFIKPSNNGFTATVPKSAIIEALENKLESLLNSDNKEFKELLENFIELYKSHKAKNKSLNYTSFLKIVSEVMKLSDEDFIFNIIGLDSDSFILEYIHNTIENTYGFTMDLLNNLEIVKEKNGYTIYKDIGENGKESFLVDRHVLTLQSSGTKKYNLDYCEKYILDKIDYTPMSRSLFIEFKTGENIVYLPMQYKLDLIIKSLDILFDPEIKLNNYLTEALKNLLYLWNENKYNTLDDFFEYIQDLTSNKSYKLIIETIDTAEKAAIFIYKIQALKNKNLRHLESKIKDSDVNNILTEIKEAKYKYFSVENVKSPITNRQSRGFLQYFYMEEDEKGNTLMRLNRSYPTQIVEVSDGKVITNNPGEKLKVEYDSGSKRIVSNYKMLTSLAEMLENKLRVKVIVDTYDNLKEDIPNLPENAKAFIYNGQVYVNSTRATSLDVFHEYTHILLAIIKNANIDHYYLLMEKLFSDKTLAPQLERIKNKIKKDYPNVSDMDLNEEVFATKFSEFLRNGDYRFDGNLSSIFNEIKEESMGYLNHLMDPDTKLDGSFVYTSLNSLFRDFGYKINEYLEANNGLEIGEITSYVNANAWIEDLIKLYKDSKEIGIEEIC